MITEFRPERRFKEERDAAARRLGLELQFIEMPRESDIDQAFTIARQGRAQALIAVATNAVVSHRSQLAALAAADRMLSIGEFPLMAQAGFLLTYGANLDDLGRRSIAHIDKILKGARAGELLYRTGNEVPADCQSQDCEGAWSQDSSIAAVARGRSDPMTRPHGLLAI